MGKKWHSPQKQETSHHESCVVEVPGVSGQAPVDWVHDGVLDYINTARHASREEAFCPARQPVGLHEEASGEEPVVRCHLSVHNVLCENMGAGGQHIWDQLSICVLTAVLSQANQ